MKVQKVDHVAFAVRSIDEAAKLSNDTLGGTFLWWPTLRPGGARDEEAERR